MGIIEKIINNILKHPDNTNYHQVDISQFGSKSGNIVQLLRVSGFTQSEDKQKLIFGQDRLQSNRLDILNKLIQHKRLIHGDKITHDTLLMIEGCIRVMCNDLSIRYPPSAIINLIHAYFTKYQIFGIGKNFTGCFATGNTYDLRKWLRLKKMEQLATNIDDIYFTDSYMLILTQQNELYLAGDSNTSNYSRVKWRKLVLINNPFEIDGGAYIPKFLSRKEAKYVYTTNNDIYHINNAMYPRASSVHVLHNIVNIKAIHIGSCVQLLLTNDGNVFCIGYDADSFISNLCGLNNPTGEGREISEPQPIPMPDNAKITKISVGYLQYLLISEKNELIVFGSNEKGRLGLEDQKIELVPKPIIQPWFAKNNIKVIHIACSYYCSLVITINNDCYMFGDNQYGNIGNGKRHDCVYEPYKVYVANNKSSSNSKFIDGDTTWQHTLLMTKDRQIVSFGSNKYNECSSMVTDKIITSPYIINKRIELNIPNDCYIAKVYASYNRSLIISNQSKFASFQ